MKTIQRAQIAITIVLMAVGAASLAHAQFSANGTSAGATFNAAQAAALRDALVRAQIRENLRRRLQEQQFLAVRQQQAAQAADVQRALQIRALQAVAAQQQANQRNAQAKAVQIFAISQLAAQSRAVDQTLANLASNPQAIRRAAELQAIRAVAASQQRTRSAISAQQALQLLSAAKQQAPLFSGADGPEQLISKLNSLSSTDVAALTSKPNVLDQFTPNWVKKAPGGNVLAQFGIGNGLLKELGTTDPKRIFDPNGLKSIQGKLRQAQILGNLAAGQAAENKIRNDVQKNQNLLLADKDAAEKLRQLYEQVSRTGLKP
jgi:hypothetical protein